ncbi:c-type cytochrome [Sedimenticola sp.]|uniref:c-type cytochrome n=1 Tax=Sedimenticola sp. TaxID=1940285 RepID=UPI003D130ED6
MKHRVLLFITFSLLSISSMQAAFAMNDNATKEAMVAAGKAAFTHRCKACHSPDSATNSFGPSLSGVVGRPAGTLPRFVYSRAMQKAKIVWTEANLRKWIANNEKLVPNTRMRHVSITDVTEQDFLIEYLKSLK